MISAAALLQRLYRCLRLQSRRRRYPSEPFSTLVSPPSRRIFHSFRRRVFLGPDYRARALRKLSLFLRLFYSFRFRFLFSRAPRLPLFIPESRRCTRVGAREAYFSFIQMESVLRNLYGYSLIFIPTVIFEIITEAALDEIFNY